jgi:hypothetical protein
MKMKTKLQQKILNLHFVIYLISDFDIGSY